MVARRRQDGQDGGFTSYCTQGIRYFLHVIKAAGSNEEAMARVATSRSRSYSATASPVSFSRFFLGHLRWTGSSLEPERMLLQVSSFTCAS